MPENFHSWEFLAIDLIYLHKDPVTIALVPRSEPDMEAWIKAHVKPMGGAQSHIGVYAQPVTLH